MVIKDGVSLAGVRPETAIAINILGNLCLEHGMKFTLTSVTDSKHSPGSLHYVGQAFDIRSRDWTTPETKWFVVHARQRLGTEFDIVEEKTHIHVEFQPKQNR